MEKWIEKLNAAGLTNLDPHHPQIRLQDADASTTSPWFISLFQIVSGVFAGALLLVFIGMLMTDVIDNPVALLSLSALFLMAAFLLFRSENHTFLDGLALSISVAGQVMFVIGLSGFDVMRDEWLVALLLMILEVGLAFMMPYFVHRVLSAGISIGCLGFLLFDLHLPALCVFLLAAMSALLWLKRDVLSVQSHYGLAYMPKVLTKRAISELVIAYAYTAAIGLLAMTTYFFVSDEQHNPWPIDTQRLWLQLSVLLVTLSVVTLLLRRYRIPLDSPTAWLCYGVVLALSVASFYVTGLLASVLIIILGFAGGYRLLMGLGLSALTGYVFWYYYQLDTSLLVKSLSMLVVSTVCFLAYYLLRRSSMHESA